MLIKDPVPGITATPHEENLRHFRVRVEGPPETPYAGAPRAPPFLFPCPHPALSLPSLRAPPPPPRLPPRRLCRRRLCPRAVPARRLSDVCSGA